MAGRGTWFSYYGKVCSDRLHEELRENEMDALYLRNLIFDLGNAMADLKFLDAEWEKWFDQQFPADIDLKSKEAVTTGLGIVRDRVAALAAQMSDFGEARRLAGRGEAL